ncbi:MAG TPA: hypothetical protein VFR37_17185 [Longimicrobium sp.]|nr:hypothetical protein [Longimicrobium sp.]
MTRVLVLLFACACGAMLPARADAQGAGTSFETSLGFSAGGGGGYSERDGIALDLLLAKQVRAAPAGTLVAAITAGVHGPIAGDLDCISTPAGLCAPGFPVFISAGVMGGVQLGSAARANARLLAGPAVFAAEEGGTLGLQGRLDLATPALFHVSLVAALQGAVLPRFQGETLTSRSISLGLRIQ